MTDLVNQQLPSSLMRIETSAHADAAGIGPEEGKQVVDHRPNHLISPEALYSVWPVLVLDVMNLTYEAVEIPV